jgi:hypothetical protein
MTDYHSLWGYTCKILTSHISIKNRTWFLTEAIVSDCSAWLTAKTSDKIDSHNEPDDPGKSREWAVTHGQGRVPNDDTATRLAMATPGLLCEK